MTTVIKSSLTDEDIFRIEYKERSLDIIYRKV